MSLRFLLWEDVDSDRDVIHFNAKFENDYTLPMHPQLKAALLRWREALSKQAERNLARAATTSDPKKAAKWRGLAVALSAPDTANVLLTYTGQPLCHTTVAKQAKWRAGRVGVLRHADPSKVGKENTSRVHPHAFRRTSSTLLREKGTTRRHRRLPQPQGPEHDARALRLHLDAAEAEDRDGADAVSKKRRKLKQPLGRRRTAQPPR